MVDFICSNNKGIVIATNNITSPLDLQAIERYVKSSVCIKVEYIESPRLSQYKSYLKIVGVTYLSEYLNSHITLDNVEKILKSNYIFNNIILASKPRVI